MKPKQKEVIIFVPGAYDQTHLPPLIRDLILYLEYLTDIPPIFTDHVKVWKRSNAFTGCHVHWMDWWRVIGPLSKWRAKRELRHVLKEHREDNVHLIGISLGGEIILEILKEKKYSNIAKVVLICSINEHTQLTFSHPPLINIYSKEDGLARMAMKLFSPFSGGAKLSGKDVKNIEIQGMSHTDFCLDRRIPLGKHKGKRITELVRQLLQH